jgi:LmbE family N-acetylglucosaminyl deacetylase
MEPDLLPYRAECPVARSVVVLAPHPDDEVFGCGGTLVQMQAAGASIRQIVLTSGDRAGDALAREAESLSAGQVLGLPPPEFWRLPDRGVEISTALVTRLVDVLRSLEADMLLAPSPWEVHPDHRAACQLAQEAAACLSRSLRLGFFEVGVPLRPNCLTDITAVVDRKMQAMQCFTSQMVLQNYADQVLALNRFRSYTLPPAMTHAEAFWFPAMGTWRHGAGDHRLDWVAPGGVTGGHLGQVLVPPEVPNVHVWVDCRGEAADGMRLRLQRLLDSLSMQTYPKVSAWVCASDQDLPPAWLGCPLHRVTPNDAWAHGAGFLLVAKPGDWLMPDHVARLVDALNRAPDARWAHADVGFREEAGTSVASTAETVPAGAVLWRAADATVLQTVLSSGLQVASFDRRWMDGVGPSVRVAGVSAWLAPLPDASRHPVCGAQRRQAWWQFWARERG